MALDGLVREKCESLTVPVATPTEVSPWPRLQRRQPHVAATPPTRCRIWLRSRPYARPAHGSCRRVDAPSCVHPTSSIVEYGPPTEGSRWVVCRSEPKLDQRSELRLYAG